MSELSTETIDNSNYGGIGDRELPNATGVLVLGICSIPFAFCYGVIGLVLGIVALVLASKSLKEYKMNPSLYKDSSYKNLSAGRVCAIIGTCISGAFFLLIVLYFIIVGSMFSIMAGGIS